MTYMIYQQYTTAVKEAYANHPDIAHHADQAKACREWLASLTIKPEIRDSLVEQMRVLEQAFEDLMIKM